MTNISSKPSIHSLRCAIIASLALITPACAHSWIEYAYKIAPNGTFSGDMGYPRGYLPRTSTNPQWTDFIPELLLPYQGNSSYNGDEIVNKYVYEANPQYPMLEAAPGDYIALMHYENGHVTLPQNNPNKPQNRGTIYLYGTSQPAEHEKLFDVHLLWNGDGTGGNSRGKLLATRNYDDGQCFQSNTGNISLSRAQEFASNGADHVKELVCQSDVQLPKDLKPGSVYTIYWYWDWPDLDPDFIDIAATTNGVYPWAGTFMRGDKDPHGWNMSAIARNESYASTIDIKITNASSMQSFKAQDFTGQKWVVKQNIYSKAVKDQMQDNFQVDVQVPQSASNPPGSSPAATPGSSTGTSTPSDLVTTVYVTVTAEPSTTSSTPPAATDSEPPFTTITVTVAPPAFTDPQATSKSSPVDTTSSPSSLAASPSSTPLPTPRSPSTPATLATPSFTTVVRHKKPSGDQPAGGSATTSESATRTTESGHPNVTPFE